MKPRRPRQSANQWAEIMKRFERSGLSIQDFCKHNDIAKSTFGKWQIRLREKKAKPASIRAGFQQAEAATSAPASIPMSLEPGSEVTLRLGAGLTLTIRTNEKLA